VQGFSPRWLFAVSPVWTQPCLGVDEGVVSTVVSDVADLVTSKGVAYEQKNLSVFLFICYRVQLCQMRKARYESPNVCASSLTVFVGSYVKRDWLKDCRGRKRQR
jgi:hypothetical protein